MCNQENQNDIVVKEYEVRMEYSLRQDELYWIIYGTFLVAMATVLGIILAQLKDIQSLDGGTKFWIPVVGLAFTVMWLIQSIKANAIRNELIRRTKEIYKKIPGNLEEEGLGPFDKIRYDLKDANFIEKASNYVPVNVLSIIGILIIGAIWISFFWII